MGKEISRGGIDDEDLLPFLHRLHNATLFTQDAEFSNSAFATTRMGWFTSTRNTKKLPNSFGAFSNTRLLTHKPNAPASWRA